MNWRWGAKGLHALCYRPKGEKVQLRRQLTRLAGVNGEPEVGINLNAGFSSKALHEPRELRGSFDLQSVIKGGSNPASGAMA